MTGTDWLDQLEQKAAAATAGEWETVEEQTIHSATGGVIGETWEDADAEFIAAANPTVVQTLINEVRRWKTAWEMAEPILTERDALAAKVARVEALASEWEEKAGPDSRAYAAFGQQVVTVPFAVSEIRAALADGSDQ